MQCLGGEEETDGRFMYSLVPFINPSLFSVGQTSINNLQKSPLATGHHILCSYSPSIALIAVSQSPHVVSLFYQFNQLTQYLSSHLLKRICPSLICILPPIFSSSLLSIPIQSPANVARIPLSCRADCRETSVYYNRQREGRKGEHRERGELVGHRQTGRIELEGGSGTASLSD